MAKGVEFWEQQKKELAELLEQRKIISAKIHLLKIHIRQHEEKPYLNENAGKNSECYDFLGKRYKDLTKEEKRKYDAYRAKKYRERKAKKNDL